LLALAERLRETPLIHTEVWLLATGCRETGGAGVREFLNNHSSRLADATFISLEGVGIGERVIYLSGEGLLTHTAYSSETAALAAQAADQCQNDHINVSAAHHPGGPTEAGIITRRGLRAVTISAWPDNHRGVAGRRQMDDTFDHIQQTALAQVHAFAWALLNVIDTLPQATKGLGHDSTA
jgi:hypothetical protein